MRVGGGSGAVDAGAAARWGDGVRCGPSEEEVVELLAGREKEVSIAAVNGPASVVVSGWRRRCWKWPPLWRSGGVRAKRLRVSHAFHSPLMEPMLESFRALASRLTYGPPRIPIVSTLTGEVALGRAGVLAVTTGWTRSVARSRFADGVRALHARGVRAYLELGPDGVLSAMAADTWPPARRCPGRMRCSCRCCVRTRDERIVSMDGAGRAVCAWGAGGVACGAAGWARVDLPTYAFQHRSFWPNPGRGGDARVLGLAATRHPLLGATVGLGRFRWGGADGRISLRTHSWLAITWWPGWCSSRGRVLELAIQAGDQAGL
ncbi:acyltransferase domain-containing protein [Streptosporangium amethystogenes subsp. fukuiense]|uniref:acyltransferase domain-containing protein n=1 Tax=Streptosporangium amethystogenes TaxID=2002 RepID=UPI00360CFBC5